MSRVTVEVVLGMTPHEAATLWVVLGELDVDHPAAPLWRELNRAMADAGMLEVEVVAAA